MDAEVGPSLNFEACERERVAAAFPPAQHTIDAAFARAAPAAPPPAREPSAPAAPLPEPEPPAPPPVDAGIDGAEVDLETLNELPPDVRAEVERQLMLWRATRRGAARSPPPVPDAPAPKPRARSSGARPRSSSGDAKPAAKKKTTRRKTAPEPLRPANAADVQSFFAPKPGAAKRPRWRST